MKRFRHILIPTDFSKTARASHLLGASLAKHIAAKATLLHVLPHTGASRMLGEPYAVWSETNGNAPSVAETSERLAALAAELPGVDAKLIWGHTVTGIRKYAEDHDVDLIVLGAHGESALTSVGCGSIAERVARLASCSVLVGRTSAGTLPARIVVGTDLSSEASQGLDAATELAASIGAGLVLAHVHDGPALDSDARSVLERELAQLAKGRGIATDTQLIVDGHAVRGLLTSAHENDAELIVVSAQGVPALERMVIGSVSERLARHAPCSVLIVR